MAGLTRRLAVVSDEDDGSLLKVAFATSDRIHIDQHFGSARAFAIFGVNPDVRILLNIAEFAPLDPDATDDKLVEKLALVDGCIAVYCRACGASAIRQLLEQGTQPIKVAEGGLLEDMLDALQQELREGPSSWLAKAVQRNGFDPARFNEIEMQGWDE